MNNVAETILQQLGGRKFQIMTGANSFASSENELTFRLPPGKAVKKIKAMRITLKSDDTYDVEALTQKNKPTFEVTRVDIATGVYANQLCDTFERMTGLLTSL